MLYASKKLLQLMLMLRLTNHVTCHASHAGELFLAHHQHLDGLCIIAPEAALMR